MARRKSSKNSTGISLSFLSFVAIMLVGLSLIVAFVLGKLDEDLATVALAIERVGLALAILVPAILSYSWAKRSKQWVFVLWIVAIVVVVVFYILNLVL